MCYTTELPKPLLELVELHQQQIDSRRLLRRRPLAGFLGWLIRAGKLALTHAVGRRDQNEVLPMPAQTLASREFRPFDRESNV